jgi:hypothetical protein
MVTKVQSAVAQTLSSWANNHCISEMSPTAVEAPDFSPAKSIFCRGQPLRVAVTGPSGSNQVDESGDSDQGTKDSGGYAKKS